MNLTNNFCDSENNFILFFMISIHVNFGNHMKSEGCLFLFDSYIQAHDKLPNACRC